MKIAACGLVVAIVLAGWPGGGIGQEFAEPDGPALLDSPAAPPEYERLLDRYLVRIPGEAGAFSTRFDYAALAAAPGQETLRERLRTRFLELDPEQLDLPTRKAWAINAYNFLVIDVVIEHWNRGNLESVADIGGEDSFVVFDDPTIRIGTVSYSLNRFEHYFLFADVDRDAPAGRSRRMNPDAVFDPRAHFALVCAAKGCPPLWPEPFLPQTVERQLEAVTRNALALPEQLRVQGGVLEVSKIFEWYATDFAGGPQQFLERYAPPGVLEQFGGSFPRPRPLIPWDWSLNRP